VSSAAPWRLCTGAAAGAGGAPLRRTVCRMLAMSTYTWSNSDLCGTYAPRYWLRIHVLKPGTPMAPLPTDYGLASLSMCAFNRTK